MKITRDFRPLSDRYSFDCGACSYANGFAQIDTRQGRPLVRRVVCARYAHHRQLLRGRRDHDGVRDRRRVLRAAPRACQVERRSGLRPDERSTPYSTKSCARRSIRSASPTSCTERRIRRSGGTLVPPSECHRGVSLRRTCGSRDSRRSQLEGPTSRVRIPSAPPEAFGVCGTAMLERADLGRRSASRRGALSHTTPP